jgi:phosphate/sulfate permease
MIIIGILLWITAFIIWWPLILRFSVLVDPESDVQSVSEIVSTFEKQEYIQISMGAIAIVIGTAILGGGIMLKLGKRKITRKSEIQYAEILYDKVKKHHQEKDYT